MSLGVVVPTAAPPTAVPAVEAGPAVKSSHLDKAMDAAAQAVYAAAADSSTPLVDPAPGLQATPEMVLRLPLNMRGTGMYRRLHKDLEVGQSKFGRGLFARAAIPAGTVLFEDASSETWADVAEQEMTVEQWRQLPEPLRTLGFHYAYQVSSGKLLSPISAEELLDDASWFWNHSCDPNAWVGGSDEYITARRDIAAGEEITTDYATWLNVQDCMDQISPCGCGSANCRKELKANDYLDPTLRARYTYHFLPFLLKQQREHDAAEQGVDQATTLGAQEPAVIPSSSSQEE